jgi:hypothetical protein
MITGTFNTAYGIVTVSVDAGTGTGQILSVGALKYEFDITPDSVVIERLMAVYQRFDVSWMAYAVDGQDLYDLFTTADADVTVTVAGYDGNTYTFPFMLKPFDVSIDERSQVVKTSLSVFVDNTVTVGDVWAELNASHTSDIFDYHTSGGTHDAVSSKLFIEVAMSELFGSQTNTIFHSIEVAPYVLTPADYLLYTYSDIDVTDPAQDGLFGTIAIDTAGMYIDGALVSDIKAIEAMQNLAAYEGGVFGTGFSSSFYVNRYVDFTGVVTITYDDIMELSFSRSYKSFRDFTIGSVPVAFDSPNGHIPNFPAQDIVLPNLNPSAEKSVLIRIRPGYPVLNVGKINNAQTRVDRPTNLEISLANIGYLAASSASYLVALPASGALTIEATFYGFGRVKPWETFQFDTTVPARYQGKTFRINSAEYDIVKNTTKVRAYEVT